MGRGETRPPSAPEVDVLEGSPVTSRLMSALPPKADIQTAVEKGPLMTLSGHSLERLTLPHEQEVAAVVTSIANVGVLRRLLGGDHHRAAHF